MGLPFHALALALVPQGSGGFSSGELLLVSPSLQGLGATSGGIASITPISGTPQLLYPLASLPGLLDGLAYDPWRGRILFSAVLQAGAPLELWAGDRSGAVQSLGFQGQGVHALAPTGDGRVYLHVGGELVLRWLDAADQEHVLLDAGGQPWALPAPEAAGALEFEPGGSSLLLATASNAAPCGGGSNAEVVVRRLHLLPDGSAVTMEECRSFPVDANGGVRPVGLAAIDSRTLLLTCDNNSNADLPRLVRVGLEPFQLTAFSQTNYFGSAATGGGTFSRTRGQAVLLDTFHNLLRGYLPGQGGAGTPFVPADLLSSPGGSGEVASLIEVTPAGAPTGAVGVLADQLSLAAGGAQGLLLGFGPEFAGRPYFVAGSASGFAPGTPADGVLVPLVTDVYLLLTLTDGQATPLLAQLGLLDGTGSALAGFQLPAGAAPALAGLVLHHAAVAFGPTFGIARSSNSVALELIP
jgi:hypothetical protein